MTPICPPRSDTARSAGFTLFELLVVLAILSMLALIASPYLSRRSYYVERERIAGELRKRITDAQRGARLGGKPTIVSVAGIVDDARTLAFEAALSRDARLILFPDGSSTGGHFALDGRPLLTVDWLTGEMRNGY